MTHFLRFDTHKAMENSMMTYITNGQIPNNPLYSIDIIGQIIIPAVFNGSGTVINPQETLPGWHVNFLGELPDDLSEYAVFPEHPYRTWL